MDVKNLFDVKGKCVLVTGGAKGIGRMISEGYVSAGARVFISGREAKACHEAVASLSPLASKTGGAVFALPADLQKLDDCKRLAAELTKLEPNGLHILVSNAGAAWGEDFETYPEAAWQKLLTLNLQRPFTMTQLLLPLLKKASKKDDPARHIIIGSIDGIRVPTSPTYAYSASKAGVHQLARTLAKDLGPKGVTTNVIACGAFQSKMMRETLERKGDMIRNGNPRGRIGEPEDVAGTCIFLSSRAGAYCNGAVIKVDGGSSLVSKL